MKKSVVSILLTAAMSMSLFAGAVSADEATESRSGLKIGMTIPAVSSDFMVAISEALQGYLTAQGHTVQFDSAEGDPTKQISQVENDAQMGCDAIVVWPVNGEALSSTVSQIVESGIPVLAFANDIPGASASQIAADDRTMGEAQADMASAWIDEVFADAGDGEVTVFVMTAANTPQAVERSEGMQTIAEKNSKVNMITGSVDWDSPNESRSLVENTLLSNPDIDVIMAPGVTPTVAANAYIMSGASTIEDLSKFAVFGVDQTEEVDSLIQASVNNESVLRGSISMGSIADTVADFAKAIQPYLDGGDMEVVQGGAFMLTPESYAGDAASTAEEAA